MTEGILGTIIVTLGSMIAAVGGWLFGRKKVAAEEQSLTTATALSLLGPLKGELDELRVKVGQLSSEVDLFHRWALELTAQVESLGQYPVTLEEVRRRHGLD